MFGEIYEHFDCATKQKIYGQYFYCTTINIENKLEEQNIFESTN